MKWSVVDEVISICFGNEYWVNYLLIGVVGRVYVINFVFVVNCSMLWVVLLYLKIVYCGKVNVLENLYIVMVLRLIK